MRKKEASKGASFCEWCWWGAGGFFLSCKEVILVLTLRLGHGFCFAKAVLSALT